VEDRAVRLQVESLHVHDATVARFHEDRNPSSSGFFTNEELHVQRIALFDDHVQAIEEVVKVVSIDAFGDDDDTQVRVDLRYPPRRNHRLVDAEIKYARRDSIQIRQFQRVKIREADLTDEALHGEHVSNRVAGTQPDHADSKSAQPRLLRSGQFVSVSVKAERGEGPRRQQSHDGPSPWVVDPSRSLLHHGGARCGNRVKKLLALLIKTVNDLQR